MCVFLWQIEIDQIFLVIFFFIWMLIQMSLMSRIKGTLLKRVFAQSSKGEKMDKRSTAKLISPYICYHYMHCVNLVSTRSIVLGLKLCVDIITPWTINVDSGQLRAFFWLLNGQIYSFYPRAKFFDHWANHIVSKFYRK